ncbi:MAG: hypothetical protein ABIJ56_10605 [Pseudomonadota bacterium]
MKRLIQPATALALMVALGGSAMAAGKSEPQPGLSSVKLEITVAVSHKDFSDEVKFFVQDGQQANYVDGQKQAVAVGGGKDKDVQYKASGLIINVLPVVSGSDKSMVDVQLQLEVSRPLQPGGGSDLSTWQFQTTLRLPLGKKTVVVEKPWHAEITVSTVPTE